MEINGIEFPIDLGHDHWMKFYRWSPDRELNPQYDGIEDVEKYGAVVSHKKPDGSSCASGISFDSETARKIEPDRPRWTVHSWEPLTVSPSLLCLQCGDHGFIREGKWVPA